MSTYAVYAQLEDKVRGVGLTYGAKTYDRIEGANFMTSRCVGTFEHPYWGVFELSTGDSITPGKRLIGLTFKDTHMKQHNAAFHEVGELKEYLKTLNGRVV